MSDNIDVNLGPSDSWHIRSIPKAIRQRVVDQAHASRMSVGELLTQMVVHMGNMGDAPVTMTAGATHPSHAAHAGHAVAHAVDADRLLTLLQSADLVDKVNLPGRAKGAARAIITTELRNMRRPQIAARRTQPALAAPDDVE